MPRTTLDLDASVLRELRQRGQRANKSMGQVASELLAEALTKERRPAPRLNWKSAKLGQPRVDPEHKEAVRALLDEQR